jgi:hypothetical protein
MARPRSDDESDDHIARSVLGSPGVTANRTRQEHRIASGNRRGRQARAMQKSGVVSNSKTGRERPRSAGRNRARGKKRRSGH